MYYSKFMVKGFTDKINFPNKQVQQKAYICNFRCALHHFCSNSMILQNFYCYNRNLLNLNQCQSLNHNYLRTHT